MYYKKLGKKQDNPVIIKYNVYVNTQNEDWIETLQLLINIMSR